MVDTLTAQSIIGQVRPLQFVHPLMREAVYADASDVARPVDHKRTALMLRAEITVFTLRAA